MTRPEQSEFNPYFQQYIDLVNDGDFFEIFQDETTSAKEFFKSIPEEKHNYKYAPEKWTIKDILMHLIDMDRVFSFRALVCARGDDKTLLPRADENLFAANCDVTKRSMESLLGEFICVRKSMELLFDNINEEQSKFLGNNGQYKISARALGYISIGHAIHHIGVIKEKYL
ncbi:MAG: DinB family protein [Ignavibacteriae bacterium]|nr:DinB family protein [Ignavibacteriota bacterium]MCB0746822.1 DinB family protein [Ignavibacteriota bacterium]MCB0752888.1 DinB family protein [Ignavibacteriota bacterium]MCB9248658.1 DinB family protein [Ignavibacteriales bacterium]